MPDGTTGSALGAPRIALLTAVVASAVLTAVLHLAGAPDLAVFILGAVALAGLAWIVSFATEAIGERFGPAVTGVLQSTLGNLPELFVVLFALSAGEIVVAQTSILGSLFANALLVLGLERWRWAPATRRTASCASAAGSPTTQRPSCCSPPSSS